MIYTSTLFSLYLFILLILVLSIFFLGMFIIPPNLLRYKSMARKIDSLGVDFKRNKKDSFIENYFKYRKHVIDRKLIINEMSYYTLFDSKKADKLFDELYTTEKIKKHKELQELYNRIKKWHKTAVILTTCFMIMVFITLIIIVSNICYY